MKQKIIIIPILSIIIFMVNIGIFMNTRPVTASDTIKREKTVTTVTIKEGDTLWSIASLYYTADYKDIHELIYEIKESNHIDETVYIGQKIIVPYYRIT